MMTAVAIFHQPATPTTKIKPKQVKVAPNNVSQTQSDKRPYLEVQLEYIFSSISSETFTWMSLIKAVHSYRWTAFTKFLVDWSWLAPYFCTCIVVSWARNTHNPGNEPNITIWHDESWIRLGHCSMHFLWSIILTIPFVLWMSHFTVNFSCSPLSYFHKMGFSCFFLSKARKHTHQIVMAQSNFIIT